MTGAKAEKKALMRKIKEALTVKFRHSVTAAVTVSHLIHVHIMKGAGLLLLM